MKLEAGVLGVVLGPEGPVLGVNVVAGEHRHSGAVMLSSIDRNIEV